MGLGLLASREEVIKVLTLDNIMSLQEYVITVLESDDVANSNFHPGVDSLVVDLEPCLLISKQKIHF